MSFTIDAKHPIAIIGAGGLGKEVLCVLGELFGYSILPDAVKFLVEEKYLQASSLFGIEVLPFETHRHRFSTFALAIGDLNTRIRLVEQFSSEDRFPAIIHPSAQLTPYTYLGKGAVVLGQTLLSCDVTIGNFALINPGTTISHDSKIGHFFTTSPGVNISGTCQVGDRVFLGTNASIRNAISIADDVVIGMGAVVVGDITTAGTYFGNPATLKL